MFIRMCYILLLFALFFSRIVLSQDEEEENYNSLAKDIIIKLYIGGCQSSRCSSYSITIHGDGIVEYEGHRSISKLGKTTKHIPKKNIAKLMSIILNAHFFSRTDELERCSAQIKLSRQATYEDKGSCVISDHGLLTIIEVNYGNHHRKVRLRHLFSEDYKKIKQEIINTAGVRKWIKKK